MNDPNVWDISAAGHVSAGETSRVGAVRELKEELGIDALPDELVYIGENRCDYSLRNGTYIDREIQDVYLANKDVIVDDLVLQPEEVVEAKWIYFTQLEKDLKFHQERYTDQGGEYQMLFEYLSALSWL